MSASINKVQLLGNIGKPPEIRTTQDGSKITNFTVATNEHWKDKNTGEKTQKTEWHKVVVFNSRLSEIAEKYLKKGSKVYIEGQLQTRKWTDKSGVEHYTTEVILQKFKGEILLMDSKEPDQSGQTADNSYSGNYGTYKSNSGDTPYVDMDLMVNKDLDDEIPF